MADILVDERDQKFVLFEQFEIDKFSESEIYAEFDTGNLSHGSQPGQEAGDQRDDADQCGRATRRGVFSKTAR